ncbi:hypothetical protein PXK56_18255 [Phaeobacter gallaeciensis]|uniref:hypothetical protein n=1 Tax=Phaeobacter gallaeciensis TaxID=60890 RepID=UPI0023805587|nr:hypothetical protein [Phaeobacter gallaeciensis]MDE4297130.1 hypothetical protein [Phaeobacter gallaeciensis]
MSENKKRAEPTRVLAILRQIESLSYAEFLRLSEVLNEDPGSLHGFITTGIEEEKGKST